MEIPLAGRRVPAPGSRVLDGALVLGCLFLTALAVKTPWASAPRPVIAAAGIAASLAQWPGRRHPYVAALAGSVAYPLTGGPGPLLAGLYAGAAYGARRLLWVPAIAGWAGVTGWSWLNEGAPDADDAVFSALLVLPPLGLGAYLAVQRELKESLRERAERAETERLLRDEQARSAERTRIAREMHDVLAHKVSLIALHAGALELGAEGDPERVRQGAGLIRVTAREALQELRTVLGVLRTGGDEDTMAEPFTDLESLIHASAQAGQEVELRDDAGELPPDVARVVHRVVREGLTNARKHSPGSPVAVSVRKDGREVTVLVENPAGRTAPMDLPGSGSGLTGLAERIRLAGGTMDGGPAGDGGWRLRARVPVEGAR
ncbi:sensor histidine kinase [Actinocorallia populi]|uniref:sensor histidine kinase n=1 Tax=Actinocorallia populi TaxID=2079200 RepID=UPI000D0880F0|nr:histidine kinase [Actinocorallia populi]